MKESRKNKKQNIGIFKRQFLSALLALVLFISIVPYENLCPAFWVEAVEGQTVLTDMLVPLVERNLGSAARYSELTNDIISETFKAQNTNKAKWSTMNLYDFMTALGDKIKDEITYTVKEGEEEKEVTENVNPWLTASSKSSGSPYKDHSQDFFGNAMNTGYTLGAYVLDYCRNNMPESVLLSDDAIINVYDQLAGLPSEGESDPFVETSKIKDKINGEANSASIGSSANQDAQGYIDTDKYIKYVDYVSALANNGQTIPAGTLFVGTWLMDAQTVNDTFYHMALNSMSEANQQIMYYKSELAGNRWKDIYGANSLESILPISENVQDTELMNYYVSVVVGSDGIPKSAKTGEAVDIFSLSDPYQMESIPELRALKMQFDSKVVSPSDQGSKRYIYERLDRFFKSDDNFTRNENMQRDCDYVLDVASRSGIAFYASDPRYFLARFEESGRGFLENQETVAEIFNTKVNYVWQTSWPLGLIRGSISWTNEKAWEREVRAMGGTSNGLDELNNRFYNFQQVWRHFSCVRDEVTDDYDTKLKGMGDIYKQMCSTGDASDKELADKALAIQEKLDSGRRARVYYNLTENEKHNYIVGPTLPLLYQWVAYGNSSVGRDYQVLYKTTEDFSAVSSISEAVESALTECGNTYIKYNSNTLTEGNTVASKLEYDLSNAVINKANQGPAAVRNELTNLVDLENVNNSVIAHKTRELGLINNVLDICDTKYIQYVHMSAGETYLKAKSDPETTQSTLDEILMDQEADVLAVGTELQRYIKARAIRLNTEAAIEFVEGRLDWAENQRTGVSPDEFGHYAEEALNNHIKWLQALLASIKQGGDIKDEEEELEEKKAELENLMKDANDNGETEKAEEYQKQINEISKQIEEVQKRKQQEAGAQGASGSQIAGASTGNSPAANAKEIIDQILEHIEEGEYDEVDAKLDALEVFNPPGIKDVVDSLELHGAPVALINKAKAILANVGTGEFSEFFPVTGDGDGNGEGETGGNSGNVGGGGDGGGTGTGTGTDGEGGDGNGSGDDENPNGGGSGGSEDGDGNHKKPYDGDGSGLDRSDFEDIIDEMYGDDPADRSETEQASIVASLMMFADINKDETAYEYGLSLLNELLDKNCPFIYRQYLQDQSVEYVSLAAIDKCRRWTRFRLVDKEEDEEKSENRKATMQQFVQGTASYVFELDDLNVTKNDEKTDKMDIAPVSQEDASIRGDKYAKYPYIAEKYSGKYLFCTCVYVPETEWAILITPQMDKRVGKLLDAFDIEANKTDEAQ